MAWYKYGVMKLTLVEYVFGKKWTAEKLAHLRKTKPEHELIILKGNNKGLLKVIAEFMGVLETKMTEENK